jgi:hypothetical protein
MQMDYDDTEEMAAILRQASEELRQLSSIARQWSATFRDGALLGEAGEVLAGAFEGTLSPKVVALAEKAAEMEKDVLEAIEEFKGAATRARGRFS